jgi:hypothetical protein
MGIITDIKNSLPRSAIILGVLIFVCIYLTYVTDALVKCQQKHKEKMYTSTKRPNPIPPLMDPKDGAYGVAVTIPRTD